MITDHKWRPVSVGPSTRKRGDESPCAFMGCRRPKDEHERAAAPNRRWPEAAS